MNVFCSSLRASSSKTPILRPLLRSSSFQAKQFVPNPNGPNVQIVRWLMKILESDGILTVENGSWKAKKFMQAFQAIDACPTVIHSGRDALAIVGVGEGIARRIDEYLHPQIIEQNKHVNKPQKSIFDLERDECITEFRRVPGIGAMKAGKLFDAGCRTLGDLRHPNHAKLLSAKDKIALEYVDHLEHRVTRAEAESVLNEIRQRLSDDVQIHAVGSYRRGIATSSGIDLIVFHPSFTYVPDPTEKAPTSFTPSPNSRSRSNSTQSAATSSQDAQNATLRRDIIGPLERAGLITGTLSESSRRWQGMARVSGLPGSMPIYRRMDISIYPTLSEGAALLAKTGDTDFNTHVRSCAAKQGLLLNEYGLWKRYAPTPPASSSPDMQLLSDTNALGTPVRRTCSANNEGRWELIASLTETGVLDALGVGFVEPEKRNFSFILQRSRFEAGAVMKACLPVQPRPKTRVPDERHGSVTESKG